MIKLHPKEVAKISTSVENLTEENLFNAVANKDSAVIL